MPIEGGSSVVLCVDDESENSGICGHCSLDSVKQESRAQRPLPIAVIDGQASDERCWEDGIAGQAFGLFGWQVGERDARRGKGVIASDDCRGIRGIII